MANRQMVELECRNNCAANRRRASKCKARSRLLELALSQKMYVMSGREPLAFACPKNLLSKPVSTE
jgi:hypothetical protein